MGVLLVSLTVGLNGQVTKVVLVDVLTSADFYLVMAGSIENQQVCC